MSTPAIQIQNLTKAYGAVHAVRGIAFDVQRSEIFGFLGPNGAGKTTTIRCLLDLIRPTSGALRVLDIDPQRDPVAVRARVGYLPGELRLDENQSPEQLMRYFFALRGMKGDWPFVRGLADRLDLDLKRPIKQFSKGNKQKVGVVQAMMHRPELLLLDEPTGGLDPLVQQEVLRLVREARDEGATVFFSSHMLSEVQAIADRVGIIRQGEIAEIAETRTLLQRALRRATITFAGEPDAALFASIPGVTVLGQDGERVRAQVEGEMDPLIKALAAHHIRDFETERPSLEEIFLAYYESGAKGGAA